MKNLLCVIGIMLLILLIITPPVLRLVLPDKVEPIEEVTNDIQILSCNSPYYIVSSSYESKNVKRIVIRKFTSPQGEEGEEIKENEGTTIPKLDELIESLRYDGRVIYENLEDGAMLTIDFSVYTKEEMGIPDYVKIPTEQQAFYQQQGLTCILRDSN